MEIRVWQSFSCNNSGSYYLVATFDDAQKATASAKELNDFLKQHAKEVDAIWDEDGDPTETATAASLALAEKHGFAWEGFLLWGDEGAEDDEPNVAAAGKNVVIHHSYCGGFGEALPKYFQALGAKPEEEVDGTPSLSVLLKLTKTENGAKLASELDAFFGQAFPEDDDYPEEWTVQAPWGSECANMVYEDSKALAYFNDGENIGFFMPFNLAGFEELAVHLKKRGVSNYQTALEAEADRARFRAIATASCRECQAVDIRFLEAAAFSAPADQIACQACGGMFPLAEFIETTD